MRIPPGRLERILRSQPLRVCSRGPSWLRGSYPGSYGKIPPRLGAQQPAPTQRKWLAKGDCTANLPLGGLPVGLAGWWYRRCPPSSVWWPFVSAPPSADTTTHGRLRLRCLRLCDLFLARLCGRVALLAAASSSRSVERVMTGTGSSRKRGVKTSPLTTTSCFTRHSSASLPSTPSHRKVSLRWARNQANLSPCVFSASLRNPLSKSPAPAYLLRGFLEVGHVPRHPRVEVIANGVPEASRFLDPRPRLQQCTYRGCAAGLS